MCSPCRVCSRRPPSVDAVRFASASASQARPRPAPSCPVLPVQPAPPARVCRRAVQRRHTCVRRSPHLRRSAPQPPPTPQSADESEAVRIHARASGSLRQRGIPSAGRKGHAPGLCRSSPPRFLQYVHSKVHPGIRPPIVPTADSPNFAPFCSSRILQRPSLFHRKGLQAVASEEGQRILLTMCFNDSTMIGIITQYERTYICAEEPKVFVGNACSGCEGDQLHVENKDRIWGD